MPRNIHRHSRTTIKDDEPVPAHSTQPDTSETQLESTASRPVDDLAGLEVTGGNDKSYLSRNRQVQPVLTRSRFDPQHPSVTSNTMADSVRRDDHSNRVHDFRSTRSTRGSTDESDDSAISDSDESDSSSVVTGAEQDATESSDSALESTTTSSNSEDERDSLEHEEKDQDASEVEEDQDTSEIEKDSVSETSNRTQLEPVRSSDRAGNRKLEVNRPFDRRATAETNRKPQRTVAPEAIYLRISHAASTDAQRKLLRKLKAEYPGALIVLDDSQVKTSFAERTAFALLWQSIQDGRIDCLWISRLNHICKSKETFQLFEWMCQRHGVRILLQPALELAIKAARANM
jgi:hypothetical protein